MKSKVILISVSLLLFCLVTTYIIADNSYIKESHISADHMIYNNVDEIVKDTDLAVKVVTTEESKNVLYQKDGYPEGYTLTQVKVLKVYNDNINRDIAKEINVIEPTYLVENGITPGQTRFSYEEYTPLVAGHEYILFLKWNEERNGYWIHSLEQGKVNLNGSDKKEISKVRENTQLKELQESVKKKFQ